jgi:hypothetical protein
MNFKPIDEMSLRHLFSSEYALYRLQIEYVGPVLNHLGAILPSPDCKVLDKTEVPYKFRNCEFKFCPNDIRSYQDNGYFDIAIVWDLPMSCDKEYLRQQLREQHRCYKLIVLSDDPYFRNLPDYVLPENPNLFNIQKLENFLLNREPDAAFAAYLIAKAYPRNIDSGRLINLLVTKFDRILRMGDKGRGGTLSGFRQTEPPLVKRMYKNFYCWNNDYSIELSINKIYQLIRINFRIDVPGDDLVEEIIAR